MTLESIVLKHDYFKMQHHDGPHRGFWILFVLFINKSYGSILLLAVLPV